MSHTQGMVMITPVILSEILEGEILVFVKQNHFEVLNSTCVDATADTNINQGLFCHGQVSSGKFLEFFNL